MPTRPDNDDADGLPPPGSRWGQGAQSVLPYLTKTLRAKPLERAEAREARPRPGEAGPAGRPKGRTG